MRRSATNVLCVLAVALAAPAALADLVGPATLTMDPNGATPLAGVVDLETDVPSTVTLEITDGIDLWRVIFPDVAQVHSLPVLGLKPNRAYTIDVILNPGGNTGAPLLAVTGPLPEGFPVLVTLASDPSRMEPGYTLVDCVTHGRGDARQTYMPIVDARGDLVWYSTLCGSATLRLPDGHLRYRCGTRVCRIDLLGNLTTLATLADPGVALHHELIETAHGTYVSLSRKTVETTDYPSSYTDPTAPTQTAQIAEEPVVEFAMDGTLLGEWDFRDIIDPRRIGYDSLFATPAGLDWIHDNAVVHDPSDDSFLVSLRHQDAVVKFSRATGELIWILGPHDNWPAELQPYLLQPVGSPFEWSYHQHAPMFTPDGNLLLFDNGNRRTSPYDGLTPIADVDNYSRAVEYAIDEQNMEVSQVWQYGNGSVERVYAGFVGDADWMPTTGNVLIAFAGTSVIDGVTTTDLGLGTVVVKIVEVDHGTPAEPVFNLMIYDDAAIRANAYRAERIPSLYPPGVTVVDLGPIAVGSVPDGGDVPGTPLRMAKADGTGEVTLSWGASCVSSDVDYEIYEGSLGAWTTHQPASCSTGGAKSLTLAPAGGDRYYLVVPSNGVQEGSYGTDGTGAERPASNRACFDQAVAECPL